MTAISVVLGTGRLDRESEKVARYVLLAIEQLGNASAELIDPREYLTTPFTVPAWVEDKNAQKWRKKVEQSDGFVLIVPEYNHSFPGELKLLLDSAFKEYAGKPVGIVGVSNGQFGGVRAIEHVLSLVATFGMYAVPDIVATARVTEAFDATGEPYDETYKTFVHTMLQSLMAHTLQK